MKKYVKPELFCEQFELTQHIADCAWELNLQSLDSCLVATADPEKLPGFPNLFAATANGCVYIPTEYGGTYEGYCEFNGGQNVHAS